MASIKRCFKIPEVIRNLLLVILLLLILDVLVAGLGTSRLREEIPFFSGKSEKIVLCDLLFLEGATVFGVSVFVAYATLRKRYDGDKYGTNSITTTDEQLCQKRIPFWMLIMIIGASLMGLSTLISILPV